MEDEGTVLCLVLGASFTDYLSKRNRAPKMGTYLLFANYTLRKKHTKQHNFQAVL